MSVYPVKSKIWVHSASVVNSKPWREQASLTKSNRYIAPRPASQAVVGGPALPAAGEGGCTQGVYSRVCTGRGVQTQGVPGVYVEGRTKEQELLGPRSSTKKYQKYNKIKGYDVTTCCSYGKEGAPAPSLPALLQRRSFLAARPN